MREDGGNGRHDSFWFVFALVGPGTFNKRRRVLVSLKRFIAVDGFLVGAEGSFLNVDVLRAAARQHSTNRSRPTHQISLKSMKINSLFQCGMLL